MAAASTSTFGLLPWRPSFGWVLALCVLTLSPSASAIPPAPPPKPTKPVKPPAPWASKGSPTAKPPPARTKAEDLAKRDAMKLLNEGLVALKRTEYADALDKFRAAYALFPSSKLLLNIGTSLRYLGRHAEAATTYERYLADPEASLERVREVEKLLETVMREVALVVIEPTAASAVIAIDGEILIPKNGVLRARLDPGAHTLTAKATGEFLDSIETLTVLAGERRTFVFNLNRKPPPVDDSVARTVGFAVGGVGVAAVGAGVLLGVLADKSDAAAASHCVTETLCDSEGARLGARANSQALGATIAFAAGGAALATGIVLVLTAPSAPPSDAENPVAARLRAVPPTSLRFAVGAKGAEFLVRW